MTDYELFRHPVVGQVLVTQEFDDDDDNAAPYKIAVRFEASDTTITPALGFKSGLA